MRTLAATALTTLALTSLVACGNDSKTAADLGCGDDPQIKITETGSKPLEKLELAPQEGESIELDTTMDMTVSVRADGSTVPTDSIPSMTLGMTATVESVTDDEIGMSFEYDKVSVDGDDQVESKLEGLIGTTGTITTDTTGAYVDGTIEPAPGMDTQMEGVLEQFEQHAAVQFERDEVRARDTGVAGSQCVTQQEGRIGREAARAKQLCRIGLRNLAEHVPVGCGKPG